MGFERAKITVSSATTGTGIKVTLRKAKTGPASMIFSIKGDIAIKLGWAEGDKLEVLIGTDGDHGLLRFRKNNSAGDAVVKFKRAMKAITYATINLGHQARFVDRSEAGRWCQHEEVEDGYLEIVLPRWADETAPKKPLAQIPMATKPTQPPEKPVASRAVTSDLMGDPPPGRRQMLDKIGQI
ncbi:hypothetical protein QO002_002157 [Pararhizobium capsulatum DSM 1112]|uniref:Uncharacterized protein n=1 Tax=Pararhizobium capsulatum DSM 1112 TaxID=1121113 RepID=A0ABU0BQJ5_9HYPH|nr:hypothetical protein [Pararhizobium capsulatum]MDQ0320019.1 hypothetical protein [Pararhizobium capsulatum DSM 1112]